MKRIMLATIVILICLVVAMPMEGAAQWRGLNGTVVEVANVRKGDVTKDGRRIDYYEVNVYEGHHVDPLHKLGSWKVTRDVFGEDACPYNPFVEGLTPSYRENSECKPGIYRANINPRNAVKINGEEYPWIQFGTDHKQKDNPITNYWSIDDRDRFNFHNLVNRSVGCPCLNEEDYPSFFQAVNHDGSLYNGQTTVVIRDRWDSSNDLRVMSPTSFDYYFPTTQYDER